MTVSKVEYDIEGIKVNIDEDVFALKDKIIEYRRHFHKNPEASLKEYKTAKYIQDVLTENGIDFVKVGETGTLATIKGNKGEGKTILLRGDIDALELYDKKDKEYTSENEGLCHACGHDAHASTLLSAAIILNKRRDDFSGTVKLAFQQAEEIGAGARQFVQSGHLDDVDFVYGTHVSSDIQVGKLAIAEGPQSASCDIFTIKVHGLGAHAATPHLGHDAVVATSNIVVALQNIISRQISPAEDGLISIGKIESGTRYNVIASEGLIQGTVRAFSHETRADILDRVEKIARLTAEIHGCSIEFENYDAAAPLINESEKTMYTQNVLSNVVGEENIITEREKSFGAEDFADFLAVVPGTFVRVGSGSDQNPESKSPHHNNYFDIDERCLVVETQSYVEIAVRFLSEE